MVDWRKMVVRRGKGYIGEWLQIERKIKNPADGRRISMDERYYPDDMKTFLVYHKVPMVYRDERGRLFVKKSDVW